MTRRRKHKPQDELREASHGEGGEAGDRGEVCEERAAPEEVARQLDEALKEVEELRDRHLRLAAEYDNYRKRIVRERAEARARIQAELARMILDAVDDLTRVTAVNPETASAGDVIEGVELVERKMLKELETIGVVRLGQAGDAFDPNTHEAVGAVPAPTPEQEGTVAEVLQAGYRLGDLLVRPARVRVYTEAPREVEVEAPGES